LDLKAYAEQAGKAYRNLVYKAQAWRVMASAHVCIADIRDSWRNLAEIHAASEWLRAALVASERVLGPGLDQCRADALSRTSFRQHFPE
jgi:hypothetical protein